MKILGYKLNPEFVDQKTGVVKQNYVLFVEDVVANGYGIVTKSITCDRRLIDDEEVDLKSIVDNSTKVFISTQTYKYQEYATEFMVP